MAGGWATALALLVSLALLVPVVLLPLSTAVPATWWIPLLVADLVLLGWLVARRRSAGVRPVAVSGVAVVAVVAVVASQVLAATPPITGADGRPLPGSVATLEKVQLNGSDQWITIRGRNVSNPVLLNLGMGGPGGGGFFQRPMFEPLEGHFTIVSWDEPGTGKSYGAVPFDQLDRERFVSDAVALAELVRERLGQEKIYVYGVSWSSILGVWLVQERPDLFHAFVSSGQMVNTVENDRMGYDLALRYLDQQGDTRRAAKLRRNGPPPYRGDNVVGRYVDVFDVLNEVMGAPSFTLTVPLVPFFAPEYGLVDKVNHTRGLLDSMNRVYPQLEDLDFRTQAPVLQVPVYFFVGRDDVNAMASLVEDYFNRLEAPHKELIWLDGGHGIDDATYGQFFDVMVNRVRQVTDG